MHLKNQLCTFAQGKKLKELGVTARSYFSWFGNEDHIPEGEKEPWVFIKATSPVNAQDEDSRDDINCLEPIAPAYSVAELGELCNGLQSYWSRDEWECKHSYVTLQIMKAGYEAQARAAMLIYLLEAGFISAERININGKEL